MTQGVAFCPTAEQRKQVEVLAGFGLPQHQIAVLLGCDPKTLRKHFEAELSLGDAKATAKVAQTLFNKAVGGDTASLIFWMKARAGWRERAIQEHTGPDGQGPIPVQIQLVDRPPQETREQWIARRQRELASARALLEPPDMEAVPPKNPGGST